VQLLPAQKHQSILPQFLEKINTTTTRREKVEEK
jgi:hypothetical protein